MKRWQRRKSRAACCDVRAGAVLLLLGACAGLCAEDEQSPGPIDFQGAKVDDLATMVVDVEFSPQDRMQAYNALLDRRSTERHQGLLKVLRNADEGFSAMAGVTLIEQGDTSVELVTILEERITKWTTHQGGILRAIDSAGRPNRLLRVPRAILREMIEKTRPVPADNESLWASVNMSARLLSAGNQPEDRRLLWQAVQMNPTLDGCWFALARAGRLESAEAELARMIMQNDSLALVARVAAATALASADSTAKQFVVEHIRQFFHTFWQSNINFEFLARRYLDEEVQQGEIDAMLRYRQEFGILQALLFLDDTTAKSLTLDYLRSRDVGIRMTMGLIAAKRWPSDLLALDRQTFSEGEDGELNRLLAAVAFYHPNLESQALAKGSKEEIERWLEYIRNGTVAVVSSVAGNVMGGW